MTKRYCETCKHSEHSNYPNFVWCNIVGHIHKDVFKFDNCEAWEKVVTDD